MVTKHEKTVRRLVALEMRMVEVRGLFEKISDKLVRSVGIMGLPVNKSQIKAMSVISRDDRLTMGEFCRMAGVKMPMMTEVVDKFVAEGILERGRDESDRRIVRVGLTKKGKKAMGEIVKKRANEMAELFGCLDDKEREQLSAALETLRVIMGKIVDRAETDKR